MSIDRSLNIRVDRYDVSSIGNKIFKINEFNLTTMFVILGEKRALAIDCGTGVGDYKSVLEGLTNGLPYDLVITHAHVDHIGGRGQFDKIFLSERDFPIIKDVTVSARKNYIAVMKYLMMFKVVKWSEAKISEVEKEPEYVFIKDGDSFDLGGRTIKVFETPAHTKGCLSFLLVEDRILFSGDIANPNNLMFLKWATPIDVMHQTLEHVVELRKDYDTLWASHLAEPLKNETVDNGVICSEKLARRKNFLPLIAFGKHKDFTIIHLTSKYRSKK